jgi:hypothetical protein
MSTDSNPEQIRGIREIHGLKYDVVPACHDHTDVMDLNQEQIRGIREIRGLK